MRALALMVILSACSLVTGGPAASLDGEWRLQAGTNQGLPVPVVAGVKVTLVVEGMQVGGTAACNSYGGELQVTGATIAISDLIQTEMACLDDRLMALEAAYLGALLRITTAARDGSSLILSGPQVELRFTLVPPVPNANLTRTVWVLDSLINGEAISSTVGDGATLQFAPDGTLSGSTGCRAFTGRYTFDGNQVAVTLDPYDTFGCEEGLADQDAHVLNLISSGFSATIDGDILTLTAGDKGVGYRAS